MTRRARPLLLASLCAPAGGVFVAANASAGITGYLCVAGGSGGEGTKFSDATCETAAAGGGWGHGAIAMNNETQQTFVRIGAETELKTRIGIAKVTFEVEGVECVECMIENHE